jgi:Cu+-exporting ATPase
VAHRPSQTGIKSERERFEAMTKDPMCGMTVDEASAPHAERGGKTFYFCSETCLRKFLAAPVGATPKGCCG